MAEEQAKYESQDLKDALADTSMTAEEFGQKFQKAVGENLQSHFGDVKLSMQEIQDGLSDALADMATDYIRIPMAGQVESLNAGVAAALLMYEAKRQRTTVD